MRSAKFIAGALAGVCLAAGTVSLSAGAAQTDDLITAVSDIMLGDPSGDGIINAVDASYILSLYADLAVSNSDITNEIISLCDVNKDGSVNAMDASYVLSYYVDQSLNSTDISIEDFIDEFIHELNKWNWQGSDVWDAQNPWNPWNPASSLSPDYQIDPDVDWTSFLPEGSLDEESPWTWGGNQATPWGFMNDPEQWYEWINAVPQTEIENWVDDTFDMLKEIEDTTNENE